MLNNVKKYIDKNNRRPPCDNKDEEIKKMSMWICTQRNYDKKLFIMKDNEIGKNE